MIKGIRMHDVKACSLEKAANRCRELGITDIQLVLEKSIDGFKQGNYSEEYASSIKKRLGNLKIAVLGSYINPSSVNEKELSADIEKFKEKILYARSLNAEIVGTETGYYGETMSEENNNTEEAYLHLLKTMRILTDEARKYDVSIGIEGVHCFVINTPQKMARLIKDLDSDNVKVIFDPVNYITINNYEKQDEMINDTFSLLGDKIAVIHAKDFVVEDNAVKYVLPGEGILNYELIFEKLAEYKSDIPIILEEVKDEYADSIYKKLVIKK